MRQPAAVSHHPTSGTWLARRTLAREGHMAGRSWALFGATTLVAGPFLGDLELDVGWILLLARQGQPAVLSAGRAFSWLRHSCLLIINHGIKHFVCICLYLTVILTCGLVTAHWSPDFRHLGEKRGGRGKQGGHNEGTQRSKEQERCWVSGPRGRLTTTRCWGCFVSGNPEHRAQSQVCWLAAFPHVHLVCVTRRGLHLMLHLGPLGAPLGGPIFVVCPSLLCEGPQSLGRDSPLGLGPLKPVISKGFFGLPCWCVGQTP